MQKLPGPVLFNNKGDGSAGYLIRKTQMTGPPCFVSGLGYMPVSLENE